MVKQIKEYKLLDLVNESGKVLMDGLGQVQVGLCGLQFLFLPQFLERACELDQQFAWQRNFYCL
jgi:hypothetical protein